MVAFRDILSGDNKSVSDLRRTVDKGNVSDDELAALELHVEHVLDSKIDAFMKSKHYKGVFLFIMSLMQV